MRTVWTSLAGFGLWVIASPAVGGLVVTSYNTIAEINGYAPVSQTQYYAEQRLNNVSPAVAEVFGDWTGTNAGGTTPTWHFFGNARANTSTTFTPESYRVTGAASLAYQLDTTADFVDPGGASIYTPAATAQYNGYFEIDISATYTLTAELHQRSLVRLVRFDGAQIFSEFNSTAPPRVVTLSGQIPPGQYRFLAAADDGLGNQNNGAHHTERIGGLRSFAFAVNVPEPGSFGNVFITFALVASICRTRHRSESDVIADCRS